MGINTENTEVRSTEDTGRWNGTQSGSVGVRSKIHDSCYTYFNILSSPLLVLFKFAHGASFEQDLRKRKKTQG